jgi:hypothetical protein
MKKIYFLLVALCVTTLGFPQVTIYDEDFTGQNNKGAVAGFGGVTTDLTGIDWSIDITNATLDTGFAIFAGTDHFYVTGEAFSAKDVDGNAFWLSPSIAIAGYSNVSFSLDASTNGNLDNPDTFLTQYRINGGSWTTAATNGNLTNDFNLVVSQTGLTGNTLEIRIRVNNNSDNEITTFDNVLVQGTPPPCQIITGLTIDSFTATTANISWTAGGTEAGWEIAVQTAGTGIPGGSGTAVATNSYIENSLSANTAYEVYVRADCSNTSDGFSLWEGPVNFTTPIQAPGGLTCSVGTSSYIFTENFDSDPPSGWTGTGFDGSNGNWDITNANANSGQTGPTNAYDNGSGMHLEYEASGNSSATASAISPAIDLTSVIDGAELSFYMHAYGSAMGTLNIGVSNSSSGPFTTVFTQNGELQTAAGDAWIPVGVNLNAYLGQTIYIEFKHTGSGTDYTGDMSLDYIRVEACDPLCTSPDNIVVSNIGGTSADITWDAGGSETEWEIAVQLSGTGQPAGAGTSVATNSFTDNTLSPATVYEVYVRADCDLDGYSNWAGPINFNTPIPNDDFANATPISCGNIYTGDTTLATIDEVGAPNVSTVEPNTNADNDSPNVWFRFIGTGNPVTLSTCANTSFDTEILVFTGTSGNLTNIAEGFDECSNTTYEAEVTFTSVLGTPYTISVEGWNVGDTGTFELSVICTPPAPVTYTYNGSWTPSDPSGIATDGDDIVIASGDATISYNTTVNTVTINAGGGLTVNTGVILSTTNGLALESTSTSYSSLILDGTVTGTLTYERHVNINGSGSTGSNDLISAPLTGQPFNAFAAVNPNILNNGTLYLFGPFDKTTADYLLYAGTETATLDAGVGYRTGSSDNGSFTFTGVANSGTVSYDITNYGNHEAEWNLVGNPYPSYLNVQDFLNHEVNTGVSNLALFDAGTAAIYGYDGSALNGWTIYNLANTTASTVIAPGQGFFVSADATNAPLYDLEFTPAMRSTGTDDDFIANRNAELIYFRLKASTSGHSYHTDFYFNNNSGLGFDLGYDAKIWGDTTPDFAIYSHLVQENNGEPMAIQSLNISTLTDVSIPLGVHANQGEQLTFSIAEMSLPASVNVYLDDVVANTSTLLNNSDYVFTPTTAISGTGRFFLRTSEDALSTIDNNLDTLNIFAIHTSKELVVSGQLKENTVLNLYDIHGRIVVSTPLDATQIENRINTSILSTGVYVVVVKNNTQQKTQKVIIK